MGVAIAYAGGTVTPELVLSYQSSRASGNVIHDIPGRDNPDVTLRPAGLRTGTLELFFAEEADSRAAEGVFAASGTFALIADERPTVAMYFIVSGTIERELESQTRKRWTVRVGYQEINPE